MAASTHKPIRLIIADDHALVRAGLHSYLHAQPGIHLLGDAENGLDAIQLCEHLKPDVVLMDTHMPGMDGVMSTRIIRQRWPRISVLMMLSDIKEPLVDICLSAGATGCISKNASPQELIEAIQKTHQKIHVRPALDQPKSSTALPAEEEPNDKLTQQRTLLELEMAGKIQAKILPEKLPNLEGWDIAAAIESAYETSGDFYDFIPLAYGKQGIVIGDVTNKGLGAAIFMALCSSLLRTYATHHPIMPAMTFNAVNERLNVDSRSGMFVTVFYGVLDPKLNRLIYTNAGHNPPILVSDNKGKPVDQLGTTGPALGILENTTWQQKMVKLSPGDALVMYTDGVTEAESPQGEFFGEQRLVSIIRSRKTQPARNILQSILAAVSKFTEGAPRADDIALVVLKRL